MRHRCPQKNNVDYKILKDAMVNAYAFFNHFLSIVSKVDGPGLSQPPVQWVPDLSRG